MSFDFETTTYGKWILAGEHTVIRGGGALVFPFKPKSLKLSYKEHDLKASFQFVADVTFDLESVFWQLLNLAFDKLGIPKKKLSGDFHLNCSIPLGAGMGASAALTTAISRWLVYKNFISEPEEYQFAKELENFFHGTSSGLDIAGVSSDSGVFFKNNHFEPIQLSWKPIWYLSSCGEAGVTSECIHKVQNLWDSKPQEAELIDIKMNESSFRAKTALESQSKDSLDELSGAILMAAECFKRWGLINDKLSSHIKELKKMGAKAVKPTGSGGGGFVLSLWDAPPSKSLQGTKLMQIVL